jgi:hypothetical protein
MGDPEAGGVRWCCLSQHRRSRFVVGCQVATSEYVAGRNVVSQTRERTAGRRGIRWLSDGHHGYNESVREIYRDPVRNGAPGRPRLARTPGVGLTQVVKRRENRRVVEIEVVHRFGVMPEQPHTVHVERLNGVLRDRLNCLTRQTHAFAKRDETWWALVTLCLFEHNWLKEHVALRQKAAGLPNGQLYRRRSPAMALGLTDHVWAWEEFLSLRSYQCKKE